MNTPRPAVGTGILAVLVIVVLVVAAGVSVAYVLETQPGSTNSASTHSTSTSSTTRGGETSTFYSPVSPTGLQLQIRLNTTEMSQDSGLMAQVSLFNTLPTNLSLTPNFSADAGIVNWDSYDSLCGLTSVDGIFGFALFQGHYAAGNLSQAGAPILLTPPVASVSCPNKFGDEAYVQNVEFAPESHLATLSANSSFSSVFKAQTSDMEVNATTGSCTTSPYKESGTSVEDGVTTTYSGTELAWGCGTNGANALTGYWALPANGTYVGIDSNSNSTIIAGLNSVYQNYFRQFSPASYTMVAEDMWNQTVYAHFQVVSAPGSPAEVVSVVGPIPPYNPGGPVVSVTLKNVGDAPIASLNATLAFLPPPNNQVPYSFVFNASSSNPLLPGQNIQETRTLIGGGFSTGVDYPLTINGAFVNGTQFSYTVQVQVVPPTASVSSTSSICILPGQPLGAFFRVLNASNSGPVAGAQVTATRDMPTSCGGPTESSTAVQEAFTTNNTEWYSLSVLNGGTYQVTVAYLGHVYDLTMPLGLSIYSCGTLYLPSGVTNVTTSTQTSCASGGPITTTVTLLTTQSQATSTITSRSTTTSSTTSTSTTTSSSIMSSISSPSDLILELSIGASVLGQPNAVQLNITEYNAAASYNNVSASSGWPANGLSLGSCGTLELPFGIAVYQGHYTSQNITSATPLTIFTPNANGTAGPYSADCPANPQVFSYDFAPQSDSAATRLTWAGDSSLTTYPLSASFSITGYWNSSSTFTAFGKGTYTILAGDEWGHSMIQYFSMTTLQHG